MVIFMHKMSWKSYLKLYKVHYYKSTFVIFIIFTNTEMLKLTVYTKSVKNFRLRLIKPSQELQGRIFYLPTTIEDYLQEP